MDSRDRDLPNFETASYRSRDIRAIRFTDESANPADRIAVVKIS